MTSTTLQARETSNVRLASPLGLPRNCSFRAGIPEIDTLLMGTCSTAIGEFRCPVDHPSFVDSGPFSDPLFAFPRTAVWIQHDGERAFHSDPNIVTIYNRGQRYTRRQSSTDGDRCDWFALSDAVAREVGTSLEPSISDAERPFTRSRVSSNSALYLKQRILIQQARRGEVRALELDERVIEIACEVLAGAYGRATPITSRVARRHAELVEAARVVLASTPGDNVSLGKLAGTLGTSPYHLCRLFRANAGRTLRSYRNELRCRLALEDLAMGSSTISAIAHRLGFASHAHLVRVAREFFGNAPGEIRDRLSGHGSRPYFRIAARTRSRGMP